MTSPTATASPIDPLAGHDLITVTCKIGGQPVNKPGRVITPGLAVTRDQDADTYTLTHVGSGLIFPGHRCGKHIIEVAEQIAASAVDWTRPADELDKDAARTLNKQIRDRHGYGCNCDKAAIETGGQYVVRCSTCDWSSSDDGDRPITSAKDAKQTAYDHECEPSVEIKVPGSDRWHWPSLVDDDGTTRWTTA